VNNLKLLEKQIANHYQFKRIDEYDKVYLTDLSDIHIGHKGFDEKTFKQTIDIISKFPNFLVMLGGDSFNHASKGSKSSAFEEKFTPREQVIELERLIQPIKNQIIGKIDGNHDGTRGIDFNDFSISEWFCARTDIKYFREYALFHFTLGENAYTHFFHHRNGSTGNNMNVSKMQQKGAEWRTDVVWGEHTHKRHWASEVYVDIDLRNQKPIIREQHFVNANTFLSWSGYAIDQGYRINKTGINVVEMTGGTSKKRNVRVMDLDMFLQLNKDKL
jgi:hypothetical protein